MVLYYHRYLCAVKGYDSESLRQEISFYHSYSIEENAILYKVLGLLASSLW